MSIWRRNDSSLPKILHGLNFEENKQTNKQKQTLERGNTDSKLAQLDTENFAVELSFSSQKEATWTKF